MDTEKTNVDSAVTEETVTEGIERPRKVRKPVAKWMDNLVSTVLLILYILLTGVIIKWAGDMTAQASMSGELQLYINFALFVGMGMVLFFATRTGEGKTVYRVNWFSLALILLPLVALVIVMVLVVSFAVDIALINTIFMQYMSSFYLALVLLGYCIPYSFISGFERKFEVTPKAEDEVVLVETDAEETVPVKDDESDGVSAEEETDVPDEATESAE